MSTNPRDSGPPAARAPVAAQRSPAAAAALRCAADEAWESELFFNPRLRDEQRSASAQRPAAQRPLAVLLAILIGLCSAGAALAGDGRIDPGAAEAPTSISQALVAWWQALTGQDAPPPEPARPQGGTEDPGEGGD